MIRYRLVCTCDHEFDEWFDSMGDYDTRKATGSLACPSCGGTNVSKGIMAPLLAGAGAGSMGQVGSMRDAPACGGGSGPGCGGCPAL